MKNHLLSLVLPFILITSCNPTNSVKVNYSIDDVYSISLSKSEVSSSDPTIHAYIEGDKAKEIYSKYIDIDYINQRPENYLTTYCLPLSINSKDNNKQLMLYLVVSKDKEQGNFLFLKEKDIYSSSTTISIKDFSSDFNININDYLR